MLGALCVSSLRYATAAFAAMDSVVESGGKDDLDLRELSLGSGLGGWKTEGTDFQREIDAVR
jgi:hypothetical protein